MPVWIMPLVYTLLSLWIIRKAKFFQTNIAKNFISAAFIFKVILGLANYFIWVHVIGRGDSINYIHDADMIYGTLFTDPMHYLQLTFGYGTTNVYPEYLRYISDPLKYSWDSVEYTMVRINSILYVFTFGNAWANIVILCFGFFSVAIALFKFLSSRFPEKIWLFFIVIFCIPSITIWSSGLLKEGFALAIFSLLIIQFYKLQEYITTKTIVIIVVLFFSMFFIREYVVLLFIPNLILWLIARRNKKPAITFLGITFLAAIFLIIADALTYQFTISEIVCEAQQYFILLEPDPDYNYHVFTGYALWEPIQKIPYTLNNIFFRPNILHSTSLFRLYMAVELMLSWTVLFWLYSGIGQKLTANAWLFIFIAIELLLMYGIVVTDADTMSRYRVIPLFLLFIIGIISSSRGSVVVDEKMRGN
ncbi:MAG: hypothetical protein IPL48_04825 [Bacteroidetes bacterium]|nr:hypothetical protein [Bacteroidota bacterium]